MKTITEPATPATQKRKLTRATAQLYWVAVRIPVIAHKMGLNLNQTGDALSYDRNAPWLVKYGSDELSFDSNKFADNLGVWSSGERYAALFLLNVWNPGYAKSQGWDFNLFDCVGTLDTANLRGIVAWMERPVWP
ncbi:MAG: hypothetical protein QM813_09425 [Verrucomicrobiota bacterium]